MPQALMHIDLGEEKIPVLARQSKNYWSYRIRKARKNEDYQKPPVMDNDFFNTEQGLEYVARLKKGETIYL